MSASAGTVTVAVDDMDPELVSLLESKLDSVRVPGDADKVYKDECIHSFTTIKNSNNDGLYICLNKFWAFNRSHMKEYHKLSGNSLFLRIKTSKTVKPPADTTPQADTKDEPPAKMSRKDSCGDEYEDQFELIVMPDFQCVPLPNDKLPEKIQDSIREVQARPSAPVSDLLLEDDPSHLDMYGKQYTEDDSMYQSSLEKPLHTNPPVVPNWRGRSQRPNYNSNFNRDRDRDRDFRDRDRNRDRGWERSGGASGGSGGGEASRSDRVQFHRPWR